jgi:hypothetical protein
MLAPAPKPPKATDKVAPPKATDKVAPSNNVVKNKPVAVIKEPKEPKEPTIKQACEVLLKAIDGIDGLDITLFANEIAFDLDGTKYVCPPSEVDRLLSAFKTIDSFVA